jgi:hypothetical protein
MNKKTLYIAVVVILIAIAVIGGTSYLLIYNNSTSDTKTTQTTQTTPTPTPTMAAMDHSVTYQGEEGKTALALLQTKYPDTVVTGEGANAFVTAINGYTADTAKHEFWKFTINGEDAQVGAGSYTTKSGDEIMWMIDTY